MYTFFIQCIKFSFILSICRAFAKPVQVPSRIVSEGIYGMVVKCSSSTQVRRVRVPDSAVHIFLFDFDSRANERGKTNICCTGISGDLLGLPVPRVTRSPKTRQNSSKSTISALFSQLFCILPGEQNAGGGRPPRLYGLCICSVE